MSVVLFHVGVPGLAGGYVGVDVFFVISGYLITGLLFSEFGSKGRISFKEFYARRARRLLPASTLVLLGVMIGSLLFLPPLGRPRVSADAVASALFFSNVHFARLATDYFADKSQPPFQHYWSLSVEEQFYVIFPSLLMGLLWLRRRLNIAALATGAVALITVASFVWGVQQTASNPSSAFFLLPTRAWELGIGALLAISPIARSVPQRVWNWLSVTGLAAILFACVRFDALTPFPGWAALVPVLGTAVILAAGANQDAEPGIVGRTLAWRPFQWLGKHSYAIYLLHWPLLVFVYGASDANPSNRWVIGLLLSIVVILPLSWASGRLVEMPVRNSRWLRDRAGLTLGLGAASIALVLVVSLLRPVTFDAGRPVTVVNDAALQANPTNFVPSNLTPSLQDAYVERDLPEVHRDKCAIEFGHASTKASCEYGDTSSDKSIVLFGDSHAAQWFSPINEYAKERHLKLVVMTKNSCSSFLINSTFRGDEDSCDKFQRASLARIVELKPELLIVSNLAMAQFKFRPDALIEAVASAAPKLAKLSRLVVLGESPSLPKAFPSCASDHLNDVRSCEPNPADPRLESLVTRARDAVGTAGSFVDVRSWLCRSDRCPGIMGNVLVYRDEDHVTDRFARTRAAEMAAALDAA